MAYMIGAVVGGLIITWLLSRLLLWLLKGMGDGVARILAAHGVVLVFSTVAGAYGFARGAEPDFLGSAVRYGLPVLVWLAVDLVALRGRKAKAASA